MDGHAEHGFTGEKGKERCGDRMNADEGFFESKTRWAATP